MSWIVGMNWEVRGRRFEDRYHGYYDVNSFLRYERERMIRLKRIVVCERVW